MKRHLVLHIIIHAYGHMNIYFGRELIKLCVWVGGGTYRGVGSRGARGIMCLESTVLLCT